jgi:uncharacterized protein with beta-barrel porin domain
VRRITEALNQQRIPAGSATKTNQTNTMNLLKTLRPVAYALLGMIGLTLSVSAQSDGIIPALQESGTSVQFSQNQKNLDQALFTGINNVAAGNNTVLQGQLQRTLGELGPVLSGPNTTLDQFAASYQSFLNQLSPGLYTALPTILFNSANVQNTQIQQRLWAVRAGRAQDETVAPVADGGKSATMSGKKVVAPVAEPEQKWVTFADGNGMWSQAQSVNNLPGYNSYGGGVQIGATYEFLKGLSVGPYVGYQGTKVVA